MQQNLEYFCSLSTIMKSITFQLQSWRTSDIPAVLQSPYVQWQKLVHTAHYCAYVLRIHHGACVVQHPRRNGLIEYIIALQASCRSTGWRDRTIWQKRTSPNSNRKMTFPIERRVVVHLLWSIFGVCERELLTVLHWRATHKKSQPTVKSRPVDSLCSPIPYTQISIY